MTENYINCWTNVDVVTLDAVLEKLSREKGVDKVFVLDGDVLKKVLEEEGNITESSFGMPMENRALTECKKRGAFLCVFCDYSFELPTDHVMVMEDSDGNRVGHDVPECMCGKFNDDPDAVWMGDDFVMFPNLTTSGDIKVVMLPQEVKCLSEEDGAGSPILMNPATTTDMLLRSHFGVRSDKPDIASAVLAFNPV
jgi:hypothetical protein